MTTFDSEEFTAALLPVDAPRVVVADISILLTEELADEVGDTTSLTPLEEEAVKLGIMPVVVGTITLVPCDATGVGETIADSDVVAKAVGVTVFIFFTYERYAGLNTSSNEKETVPNGVRETLLIVELWSSVVFPFSTSL